MPKLYIWSMQSSLSLQINCRFSYTHEKLEKLLINPLTAGLLCPTFAGISSLDPTISAANVNTFYKRFVGTYEPIGNIAKLQHLTRAAVEKAKVASWLDAADIYRMSIKYAQMIWKCHLKPLQDDRTQGLQMMLWTLTIDSYADHTVVLINKAKEGEDNAAYFEQAKTAAEEGITFLRARSAFTAEEPDVRASHAIEKRKAKLSYRASLACQALGDRDSAIAYVEQCLLYEPESGVSLRKRIQDLRGEEQRLNGGAPVFWVEDSI